MPESYSIVEVWKAIPDFPGYEASTFGRIRSLIRCTADSLAHVRRLQAVALHESGLSYSKIGKKLGVSTSRAHHCVRRNVGDRAGGVAVVLKGQRDRNGYPVAYLYLSDERRYCRMKVAVLVLMAFVGPRQSGYVSRHLDDDKSNSHLSNLAWGTQADNVHDMWKNGKGCFGSAHGRSKITEDDVLAIRAAFDAGESSCEISGRYPVAPRMIRRICARSHWKHVE